VVIVQHRHICAEFVNHNLLRLKWAKCLNHFLLLDAINIDDHVLEDEHHVSLIPVEVNVRQKTTLLLLLGCEIHKEIGDVHSHPIDFQDLLLLLNNGIPQERVLRLRHWGDLRLWRLLKVQNVDQQQVLGKCVITQDQGGATEFPHEVAYLDFIALWMLNSDPLLEFPFR
jgi:hypothetical protein